MEITDSNGTTFIVPVNSAGNFFQFASDSFAPPFLARVFWNGGARFMKKMQTSGDCNSCHTESGANGAPGRIVAR